METQNYANHRQTVPAFHYVFLSIATLTLIGSIVNVVKSWGDHQRIYSASLIMVLTFATILMAFLSRMFAMKAQDRAIRAEENLRHFVLAGKLLDPRLTIFQVIALRFASDGEFLALARKAAEEGTEPDDIKKSIQEWRADTYRV